MGVKDLWQLLTPIGRRVSIETLEGKKLAIDASVWIVQFIKALRDEEGVMQKNAHIIGTLRRILKLLYHKIKPVFVFDGATPQLKIRTVKARKERRTGYERDQRLVAQRILLSQIKQNLIKSELSKTESASIASNVSKYVSTFNPPSASTSSFNKPSPSITSSNSTSNGPHNQISRFGEGETVQDELVALQQLASSSSYIAHSSLSIVNNEFDVEWEDGIATNATSKVAAKKLENNSDSENSDEEPQYDLPDDGSDIDIDALAALPDHLRKDVIENARRKERMRSRSNYIPVAGDPDLYSQTQLANFLKGSNLNKRIQKAQELVEGRQEAGRRIAADGNKKYVLSHKNDMTDKAAALSRYAKSADYDWLDEVEEDVDADLDLDSGDEVGSSKILKRIKHAPGISQSSSVRVVVAPESDIPSSQITNELHGFTNYNNGCVESVGYNQAGENEVYDPFHSATTIDNNADDSYNYCNSGAGGDVMQHSVYIGDIESTKQQPPFSSYTLVPGEVLVEAECVKPQAQNLSEVVNDIDDVDWVSDDGHLQPQTGTLGMRRRDDLPRQFVSVDDGNSNILRIAAEVSVPTEDAISNLNQNGLIHDSDANLTYRGPAGVTITPYVNERAVNTVAPDVAERAVNMASGMGDWAGRAVQRVLKQHMGNLATGASSTAPNALVSTSIAHATSAQPNSTSALTGVDSIHSIPLNGVSISPSADQVLTRKIAEQPEDSEFILNPGDYADHLAIIANSEDHISDVDNDTMEIAGTTGTTQIGGANSHSDLNAESTRSQTHLNEVNILSKREIEAALKDERLLESLARRAQATYRRDAEGMTEEMRTDVIALLDIFDIPYIIAPYEAEAQCAVLEKLGAVEGVVTEDSDAFLFGAQTVYRNIFSDKKYVEAYLASEAAAEIGLDREDFVALAFFLGSDYTEGVNGIGIVNSLEILQAFPVKCSQRKISDRSDQGVVKAVEVGLGEFKRWVESFDPAKCVEEIYRERIGRNLNRTAGKPTQRKKKTVKFMGEDWFSGDNEESQVYSDDSDFADDGCEKLCHQSVENDEDLVDDDERKRKLDHFTFKHRSGRMSWRLNGDFPNRRVIEAYMSPAASYDAASFEWPVPKLHRVRRYCAEVLGWTDTQMDAQIDPVIRRVMDKTIQPRIDSHFMSFEDNHRFAHVASTRLQTAVAQITGKSLIPKSKPKLKRTTTVKKTAEKTSTEKLLNAAVDAAQFVTIPNQDEARSTETASGGIPNSGSSSVRAKRRRQQ